MSHYNEIVEKTSKNYLNALLNKERNTALSLIKEAINKEIDIQDIYIDIFQKTQYAIGDLWMTGKISVAQEHFCTAVTQTAMAQLYNYIFQTEKIGKTFLAFCISEELHDIGLKMVSDIMEMSGWDTIYLGANVPSAQIEEAIQDYKADVLGISISIAKHINTANKLIQKIRDSEELSNLKVIVGGYTINHVPGLWQKIGADAFAEDAISAKEKVKQLVV